MRLLNGDVFRQEKPATGITEVTVTNLDANIYLSTFCKSKIKNLIMILDWNALKNAVINETPYRWMQFENLIAQDARSELIKSFPSPTLPNELHQENVYLWQPLIAAEKDVNLLKDNYELWRDRYPKGLFNSDIQKLSLIWQQLIQELWTPAYRNIMQELSGLNLQNHVMTG